MRCRDARFQLIARRDTDDLQLDDPKLTDHLKHCSACHTFERRQQRLEALMKTSTTPARPNISTERILQAVERQRRITQQLEDLRAQQRERLAWLVKVSPKVAIAALLLVSMLSLATFALIILQPDLIVTILALLSGGVDILLSLGQYIQAGLALVTSESWLLSGVALAFVVMMGMWLRLVRPPQEA
ncbi:MAG TPA: hypothetical protein VFA41_24380 [Ktedonobacteraceae bacterium]|jgi:predicted anti-sigma-YlaC factor YlaD|nr:hypothetical protein [Ktedonobacteraceae bacterium]